MVKKGRHFYVSLSFNTAVLNLLSADHCLVVCKQGLIYDEHKQTENCCQFFNSFSFQ